MKKNSTILKSRSLFFFATIILVSFPAVAQWEKKSNATKPRSDMSESIVYNSKLYTFMGFSDRERNCEPTSEVYDPATDKWRQLAAIPKDAAVTHQKIVLIDNTVWHIGGRVGKNPGPLTSAIWIYNIDSDSWSRGPELRDPATNKPLLWAAGGAALLGRTLHVFGGFINNACDNDQSTYHLTLDVDSWLGNKSKPADWDNEAAPLPVKRNHFSTVVLGGKIYAIGGQFGHDCRGGQEQRYSHVYDPVSDEWKALPLLPEAHSHAEGATFAADGKIYVFGGQDGEGKSTNKVLVFNPEGNNRAGSWKEEKSLTLPKKYEGGSAKVIGDLLIYSHGGERTSANPRNKTYTRRFKRDAINEFGFPSQCLKLNLQQGKSVKSKTLLFTIDGRKSYRVSSSAQWLSVSRNATGTASPTGVDIELTVNTSGLPAATYSATVTAMGTGAGPNYTSATYCVTLTVKGSNSSLVELEAETAELKGAKVASNHPNYTGNGFADFIHPSDDYVEWTVNRTEAGRTVLGFKYSNGKEADRPMILEVNGVKVTSNLSFPSTRSWSHWSYKEATVNLKVGKNTVRLVANGYSGPNIDHVALATNTFARGLTNAPASSPFEKLNAYVSPNPAIGNARLILNSSSQLPIQVELVDFSGRSLKSMRLSRTSSSAYEFSVQGLAPGTYVMKVRQGNSFATTKLMVSR